MAIQEFPGQLRRRRDGGAWHYLLYLNGKLWERSTGEKNLAKAKKKANELRQLAQLLKDTPPESRMLSQAIVREVARVKADVSTGQADRVSDALQNFLKWIKKTRGGDILLERIDADEIEAFQRERLKTKATNTVAKEICYLRRMLRQSGFEVKRPSPKKGKKTDVRAFSRDELGNLFNATPARLRCLFATLLTTGARLAELVPSPRSTHTPLLKKEVDLEKKTLVVRSAKRRNGDPKKDRVLAIPDDLVPLLKEQMQSTLGHLVFPRFRNLPRDFNATLKRAKIPRVSALGEKLVIHSLRHTYATLQAEAGLNVFGLKEIMGHSQLSTLQRYVHPTAPLLPISLSTLWQKSMANPETAEENEERKAS